MYFWGFSPSAHIEGPLPVDLSKSILAVVQYSVHCSPFQLLIVHCMHLRAEYFLVAADHSYLLPMPKYNNTSFYKGAINHIIVVE